MSNSALRQALEQAITTKLVIDAVGLFTVNLEINKATLDDSTAARVARAFLVDALELALAKKPEIAATAVHLRLWDLVRYCRHELHTKGLITNLEYGELVSAEDSKPGAGSPSAKRLADYDELAHELADRRRMASEFESFLKDGETPLECLKRNRGDIDALMTVLAQRTQERDDLRAAIAVALDTGKQVYDREKREEVQPENDPRLCVLCGHAGYLHSAPGVCAVRLPNPSDGFCCCEEFKPTQELAKDVGLVPGVDVDIDGQPWGEEGARKMRAQELVDGVDAVQCVEVAIDGQAFEASKDEWRDALA